MLNPSRKYRIEIIQEFLFDNRHIICVNYRRVIMCMYLKGKNRYYYYYYYYYYGSTALCCVLANFTVSRSYTQSVGLLGRGDQPVARPLPIHITTQTE
jgi:hypothetical protein